MKAAYVVAANTPVDRVDRIIGEGDTGLTSLAIRLLVLTLVVGVVVIPFSRKLGTFIVVASLMGPLLIGLGTELIPWLYDLGGTSQ